MSFLKNLRFKLIQKILETNEKLVFDKRTKKALSEIISNPKIILDVGANKGQSIELYRNWFPSASIFSFEPNPRLFALLKEKYQNDEKVNLFNFALSNHEGEMTFYENKFDSSSTLEMVNPESEYLEKKAKVLGIEKSDLIVNTYPVKVRKLSNFISEQNFKSIDFVKIDVEGHEFDCLRGLFDGLNTSVKCIQIEAQSNDLYQKQTNLNHIKTLIKENGFSQSKEIKHGFGGFSDILFWKV